MDIVFIVDESGSICDNDDTFEVSTGLCDNWLFVRKFLEEFVANDLLDISPDGTQQVAWSSGGRSFAYRTGPEVDSNQRFPGLDERLLRAWTIDELEEMASQSGFGPSRHDEAALMIHFARSD